MNERDEALRAQLMRACIILFVSFVALLLIQRVAAYWPFASAFAYVAYCFGRREEHRNQDHSIKIN